jgi:hypothetical protein
MHPRVEKTPGNRPSFEFVCCTNKFVNQASNLLWRPVRASERTHQTGIPKRAYTTRQQRLAISAIDNKKPIY